jgi:hypothetical protein
MTTISSKSMSVQFPSGMYGTLDVIRNDGLCWGRVHTEDGEWWDVSNYHHDYYNDEDGVALLGLALICEGKMTGQIVKSAYGWDDSGEAVSYWED